VRDPVSAPTTPCSSTFAIIFAIFVAINRRRRPGWYFVYPGDRKEPFSHLWYQPLYVDEKDGILKRTDCLPEEKARRRARRSAAT
jgi:hypothetical protein